jgi:hypothetical protein
MLAPDPYAGLRNARRRKAMQPGQPLRPVQLWDVFLLSVKLLDPNASDPAHKMRKTRSNPVHYNITSQPNDRRGEIMILSR